METNNAHSFQIFTDSSCDLPKDLRDKHEIGMISYLVNAGGDPDHYVREAVDMSVSEFYDIIRSGDIMPKTSMPSIFDYTDAFETALKKGIDVFCITLTSKFSGSFSAATNAKKILEEKYPDRRVIVFDSKTVSGGEGVLVLEAAKLREKGLSMDKTNEELMKIRNDHRIFITVDTLKYLQKGGRIGKVSSFAGTLLNIKPVIVMKDGELNPASKVRGRKKTLSELAKMLDNDIRGKRDDYYIFLLQGDAYNDAVLLEKELLDDYGYKLDFPLLDIGMTIGAHIGPTVIGLGYLRKSDAN